MKDDVSKDDTDNSEGIAEYCAYENIDYCLATEWLIDYNIGPLDRVCERASTLLWFIIHYKSKRVLTFL